MDCFGCYRKMEFSYVALTLQPLQFVDSDEESENAGKPMDL